MSLGTAFGPVTRSILPNKNYFMKTKMLFLLLISLSLVRCHDTETFVPDPDPVSYKASAFVEVKDVNGTPVEGVQINVGNIEGFTDKDGLLFVKNATMNPSTYLTAEKQGFFHGSRRFYPTEGDVQFVRITLLPQQLAGSIPSNAGGSVQIADGVSLTFPGDAVMYKNGGIYDGPVSVYGQPLKADDPQLSTKMPGDLVGISNEGTKGTLGSLGMMVVELKSATGDLLQVKPGSHVEMQMEVPASKLSTAPATIPMWYFNEATGYWQEEGEASLVGNKYVAQLGHFSYWNCDVYFDLVSWSASFVYEDGSPASQVEVCLTVLSLDLTRCDYTNNSGVVSGEVAANEAMLLEVKSPCGDVIYSQQIGPYTDATVIGPITIPSSSVSFTAVSGNAVDCNGETVTNGFARIQVGEQTYYSQLNQGTGAFSISVMNCDESDVTVSAVDETAFKQSLPYSFAYAPVIDAGTISVCETITEFLDLEVTGFPDHFIFFFPFGSSTGGNTTLVSQDSSSNGEFFYVRFNGDTPGTYSPTGAEISVTLPNGDRAFARAEDVTINITYFGVIGDYILGTVSGTWHTGPNGQGGPDYPMAGSFSILRE